MKVHGSMGYTFEELAAKELDRLWHGALFLCAGDERAAELLLERTLRRALASFRVQGRPADPQRWLDNELVMAFRENPVTAPVRRGTAPIPGWLKLRGPAAAQGHAAEGDRQIGALLDAAGDLPEAGRAALWLFAFRRWNRRDTAAALGVDRTELQELLDGRDVLIRAVLPGGAQDNALGVHR